MSRTSRKSILAITTLAALSSTCLLSESAAARGSARRSAAPVHTAARPARVSHPVRFRPTSIRTIASAISRVPATVHVATSAHALLNAGHVRPATNLVQRGNGSLRPVANPVTANPHPALSTTLLRPTTLAINATSLHTDTLKHGPVNSNPFTNLAANAVLKSRLPLTVALTGIAPAPAIAALYAKAKSDRMQAQRDQALANADFARAAALRQSGAHLVKIGRASGNNALIAAGIQQEREAARLQAMGNLWQQQANALDSQAHGLDGR